MYTVETFQQARAKMMEMGLRQSDVAVRLGIHPSLFNKILVGTRKAPDGLAERLHTLLDQLEAAQRAADEARERVLAGFTEEPDGTQ